MPLTISPLTKQQLLARAARVARGSLFALCPVRAREDLDEAARRIPRGSPAAGEVGDDSAGDGDGGEVEWTKVEVARKRRKESKKYDVDCHNVSLGRFPSGSGRKLICSTSQNSASDKAEASHIRRTRREAGQERIVRDVRVQAREEKRKMRTVWSTLRSSAEEMRSMSK